MEINQSTEQVIKEIVEQGIIEAIGDAISIQNTDLKILYQNQRHKDIIGNHVGEYCYQAYERRDQVCEGCPVAMTFKDGDIYTKERTALTDRGTLVVEITSSPLRDKTGKIIAGIEVVRDITERKRVREVLKEKERFLTNIFTSIQDGISILDKELNIVRVNPAVERWFPHEMPLVGKKCYKAYHERKEHCEVCPTLRTLKTGKADYELVPKQGREGEIVGWLDLYTFPLVDELTGRRTGVIEYARDITERKRAERELNGSEQRYRAVVEDMPAMICRFLPDGTLTFVNKEYCRHFDKRSEELINQNFFQFIPESDQEKIRNHYLSLGKENPMVTYEHQVIAPDGRLCWQIWTDRALFNERGEVTEYQSIGRDITNQKKLEEELLRSQKLESVGILAGGIAHDFNNLITAILSNIYLSKKYLDPGHKAFERLENTEKALTKAEALTKQLLTFSKGGAPVKRTISLAGVIKDSAGFALSGSNVTCELDIKDNLWPVDADEGQINQVIHNIIANADQSMPEGGIVKIHAENTILGEETGMPLQEGKYLKITVTDKGIGISEEHLQKVFDPYFTTKQKGSGLGLAVSYSIIKNHNGHILVESEVGVGSTFTIYLPASEKHIAEEPIKKRFIPGEGRILIMDDEEFVRNALGQMLMEIGYEVDSAGDGAEVIWKYEKAIKSSRPFDVVIMDLTIPGGMGGKETIKRLREVNPGIKAIVSSGYSDDPVMANFRTYGFNDVLSKPYNPEKLSHTLHKVLKGTAE